MPAKTGFGLYLLGIAGRRRPPFFYAYSTFWLHLAIGFAALFAGDRAFEPGWCGLLALASLNAALLVYGGISRRWQYLAAAAAYTLSVYLLTASNPAPSLWPAAALPPLGGLYTLVRDEWLSYSLQTPTARPWPAWAGLFLLGMGIPLFLFGLWL